MQSLRRRLMLAHIAPTLLVMPIVAFTLAYLLERHFLLPNWSQQLATEAELICEMARQDPAIWTEQARAGAFIKAIKHADDAEIMLLSATGTVLATTANIANASSVGQPFTHPGLARARNGEIYINADYGHGQKANIIDVLTPASNSAGQIIGIIRLTRSLAPMISYLRHLHLYIVLTLLGSALLHIVIGSILAFSLERPLTRLLQAMSAFNQLEPATLPEEGATELRLLTRTFNSLNERLHTLENTRQHLLANLVHEIRRPLGALSSAVHALQHGADEDAALRRELLSGIAAELQRLARQTENLALLSAQTVGKLKLEIRPTDLNEWLPAVLSTWRSAAQEKDIAWQVQLPPDLPVLLVDPDRLAQALGNLLSNAVKFTPAGGAITLQVELGADTLGIHIQDSGPGISPEEQFHIFDPFYRSPTHQRFPQGMGLGLTIARDLASAHGGELTVSSTPGVGSCFTLTLPYPVDPKMV